MAIDLKNLTIEKAHAALVRGDFTAIALAQAYLDVIAAKNKDINAYLEIFDDIDNIYCQLTPFRSKRKYESRFCCHHHIRISNRREE